MPANAIRFLRRGQIVEFRDLAPTRTVLDYLRLEEKSRGTKEGCNEGDCGACTVAIGSIRDGQLVYEPANACILLMGHLHGKELVTVDDLADGDSIHPVQKAMVEQHASQCGFCTPGFVMALFTLYHQARKPDGAEIRDHLAGNLCRCTGYRPIIAAAEASCTGKPLDRWIVHSSDTLAKLGEMARGGDVFIGNSDSFTAVPRRPQTLTKLADDHPDATIVAGATDVGLWITKEMRDLRKVIHLGGVAELREISVSSEHVSIGAAATYSEAEEALVCVAADFGEILRRIGSKQVRASGTVGGNIANGSPIGDTPPLLIALGSTITLRQGEQERALPLEDFYISYGRQDRLPGELVWRIDVPRLKKNEYFRAFKISKRFDQDISAVLGAFKFTLDGRDISEARIAYGGMAATPKCASHAEAAAMTVNLDRPDSWSEAIAVLEQDFTPISDMRASAGYRLAVARALLRKALVEISGGARPGTRVLARSSRAA